VGKELMSATIELRGITKRFGSVNAVDDVTLKVESGELVTLLGPSGCGKTTLLRLLSGFERPSSGTILVGGVDVTAIPPNKRDINQVFQSYALFPHLTVWDNIAFGLKMRGEASTEIQRKVKSAVELVALDGMERRYAHQLSGGQRQRVALARAIVPEPRVLLLDEPLSALDAKLRREMQAELKGLQRKLGLTTILVTHDQDEALAMSDRIAVMHAGRIEQLGTGKEVYNGPKTEFVAQFLGESNLLRCKVVASSHGTTALRTTEGWLITGTSTTDLGSIEGADITVSIRPERIKLSNEELRTNSVAVRIVDRTFLGASLRIVAESTSGRRLCMLTPDEAEAADAKIGDGLFCYFEPSDVILLSP
jgi:spermidine/putrescine transport system ATP-binding protein